MNWADFDLRWRSRSDRVLFDSLLNELRTIDGFESLWRRARAYHFGAMRSITEDDVGDAKAAFRVGVTEANESLGFQLGRAEGHFWKGVCQLEGAKMAGKLPPLKAIYDAKRHLERSAQIDETFHFAGPLRVLGRFSHLAPGLLGGDLVKAESYFRRALQICDNSTTRLYFADLLVANSNLKEAKAQWQAILEAPEEPDWLWEQERDREKAARHLKES